jgi:hypothetical protein
MCLPFVTKAGASQILNKLRCAKTPSVSFLPTTELGVHLGDAGASRFTKSEMITCGRVSNLYLLFEFFT